MANNQVKNKREELRVNELPTVVLGENEVTEIAKAVADDEIEDALNAYELLFDVYDATKYAEVKAAIQDNKKIGFYYHTSSGKGHIVSSLYTRNTKSGDIHIVILSYNNSTGADPTLGIITWKNDGTFTSEKAQLPFAPSATGTYTLKSVDGVLTWVLDAVVNE